MSTQNIEFYEDLTKIIFQLSSNTHLISSSAKTIITNLNQENVYSWIYRLMYDKCHSHMYKVFLISEHLH